MDPFLVYIFICPYSSIYCFYVIHELYPYLEVNSFFSLLFQLLVFLTLYILYQLFNQVTCIKSSISLWYTSYLPLSDFSSSIKQPLFLSYIIIFTRLEFFIQLPIDNIILFCSLDIDFIDSYTYLVTSIVFNTSIIDFKSHSIWFKHMLFKCSWCSQFHSYLYYSFITTCWQFYR